MLDHTYTDCREMIKMKKDGREANRKFEPWLRSDGTTSMLQKVRPHSVTNAGSSSESASDSVWGWRRNLNKKRATDTGESSIKVDTRVGNQILKKVGSNLKESNLNSEINVQDNIQSLPQAGPTSKASATWRRKHTGVLRESSKNNSAARNQAKKRGVPVFSMEQGSKKIRESLFDVVEQENYLAEVGSSAMSLLSWNCRGLGTSHAVREVTMMVKAECPRIIFLMETKRKANEMEKSRVQWGIDACLTVDCIGRAGGLALLWTSEINLGIESFSRSHINAKVNSPDGNRRWRITGFYGEPDHSKRHISWYLMRQLARVNSLPWLIVGDFNELTANDEKCGGPLRNAKQMQDFREAIEDCSLLNIPITGPFFTWSRSYNNDVVHERLDRGLVTASWLELFPHTCEHHLVSSLSDHCPLLFTVREGVLTNVSHKKPFRFENMWGREESCKEVIQSTWRKGKITDLGRLANQLEHCGAALLKWNREKFGHVQKRIRDKELELEKLLLEASNHTGDGLVNQ
ncbi:hypothetical protein DITRI_Ditri11bG0008900 [Diplodiscus trichospermus]